MSQKSPASHNYIVIRFGAPISYWLAGKGPVAALDVRKQSPALPPRPFCAVSSIEEPRARFENQSASWYVEDMPIFEYACNDCGNKFEKLVRRSDADAVRCPACGEGHLTTQYSTFAARSGVSKAAEPAAGCGSGMCAPDMCGGGMCQGGMCGMNMN